MTFRTITARMPCTCQRCGRAVAVGQVIRYGRGLAYHLARDCPAKAPSCPQDASKRHEPAQPPPVSGRAFFDDVGPE